jgi:hypothetical protein
MRFPKHIQELQSAGKSIEQLNAFRGELYEKHHITLGWNTRRREWTFGQVPKSGPTFIAYHVGIGALLDLFGDIDRIAAMFADRAAS